jgi:predicted RNA-binding Zn-ribbon protein involved in translation (DUF1610 family)
MRRIESPRETIFVHFECERCGGTMTRGTTAQLTDPIRYTWDCKECGYSERSAASGGIEFKVPSGDTTPALGEIDDDT